MTPQYVDIHTHRPCTTALGLRTAGIHPWDAERWDVKPPHSGEETLAIGEEIQAIGEEIQAIGEIGLDYVCPVDRTRQAALLREQLRLAEEHRLPVVLHCVRAFEPLMRELAQYKLRTVIFHGFIGSPEQARQALERGYYLSFGERTFASPKTGAAMRATPLSHLFFETDDNPTPIETIYARMAELRETTVDELKRATTENYERILTKQNG